jgi:hypothetical protein
MDLSVVFFSNTMLMCIEYNYKNYQHKMGFVETTGHGNRKY